MWGGTCSAESCLREPWQPKQKYLAKSRRVQPLRFPNLPPVNIPLILPLLLRPIFFISVPLIILAISFFSYASYYSETSNAPSSLRKDMKFSFNLGRPTFDINFFFIECCDDHRETLLTCSNVS